MEADVDCSTIQGTQCLLRPAPYRSKHALLGCHGAGCCLRGVAAQRPGGCNPIGARPTATSAAGDGGRRLLDDFSDGTFGRQVTGDGVNVRDKPCTDTKILGVVNEGDKVHHTGRQRHGKCGHSWSQVSFKDQEAWIALEFLTYCPGRTCTEPRNACNPAVQGAESHCCSNKCILDEVDNDGFCK
ncbi:hypothetical protein CHLNCDRAFT_142488 [Chlorella variabilis]|uniref:SH3b domain-containing protein n=1 Tax=Chlorella variabilis TaxID=554065 RepID=E1ZTR6_CHLVA|nr:hypothetical protein CHLNCDRAFT_142488 [Chlorella variabilis]EFN50761.1 hypothetical protein CHLNCDRAFT_142488 [Chlorella variabilis]|eukprot:XP_005842873.1 hypothetical protein CHLNCDRAFT_142488 [Chlorella variabilis]